MHRDGVEKDWEISLQSNSTVHSPYRAQSIEELLLFLVLNGIDREKGVVLKNTGTHIRTKMVKLAKSIESWISE